ncbi:hypothetical protein FKR81_20910 [Lentzea tibetensis]|uniref:Uncharacterized protein n=1 Tax=Lentzea tibetensis TaxID=2591470 RepID=A0A563ER90_9PSEU|nr:hypothetical protein [Lentzea tibetensis]TWP50179.1 hypothetical protein FKR81_20910 [Lentzea tibetensis]
MGSLVRAQTRSRFAIIKAVAALALVALAYVALGPVAAAVAALPIVAFVIRRAMLGRRVKS